MKNIAKAQIRDCNNPTAQYSGNFCTKEDGSLTSSNNITENRAGNTQPCPYWSAVNWGACSANCEEYGMKNGEKTCLYEDQAKGLTCSGYKFKRGICKGACGNWGNINPCPPSNACLKPGEKDTVRRKCPAGGNNCLADDGTPWASGYDQYCGTPNCGRWTEFGQCRTCLQSGETPKIIYLRCDGAKCERNGIFYNRGETSSRQCKTPSCP